MLTAVAFRWFAEQAVDVALVEVGLGGRLDATHVWDGGVAAITNVDLDHTDRLGETIPARSPGRRPRSSSAVTSPSPGATGEALDVIRRRARRMGAPLTEVAAASLLGWDRDGITVALPRLGETRVGLRGRHQAANVAVADAILDSLAAAGIATIDDDDRRRGYATARWPGRLELLEVPAPAPQSGIREVLLDGAHNPAGAAVLARALDDLRPSLEGGDESDPPPITLVLGSMADKDVAGVLAALGASSVVRVARVICTQVDQPRAMPASRLAKGWAAVAPGSRPAVEPSVERAIELALAEAPGPVVVAGSLYLVGAARALLVDDPALDDHPAPVAVGPGSATGVPADGRRVDLAATR